MEAQFTFNFDEEEDRIDFEIHCQAQKMLCVLDELERYLRNQRKYTEAPKQDSIEEICEKFYDLLGDNGVSLA